MPRNQNFRPVAITADKLFAASANFGGGKLHRGRQLASPTIAQEGTAISIDPYSDVRECLLYFDSDQDPTPLLAGDVIRRRFNQIVAAPAMPSTFLPDALSVGAGTLPAGSVIADGALVCPGVLRLQAWQGDDVPASVEAAPCLSIQQRTVLLHNLASGGLLMVFRAPGAKSIRLWGSNENTDNAAALTVALTALRPQMDDVTGEPRDLASVAGGPNYTTVTIPTAADNFSVVQSVAVDPGAIEYALGFSVDDPIVGDCQVTVGVEVTFYRRS